MSLRCGVHVAQWYALLYVVHMVWYELGLCFRVALLPWWACCDLWTLACPWRHAGLCLCLLLFQVALMSSVPSAMAALDGHRGVAVVAENGLGFLFNQAAAPENRVRLGVPGSVVGPSDSVRCSGGHISDVCRHARTRGRTVGRGDSDGLSHWGWASGVRRGDSASWMCGDGGGGDGYQ